MVRRRQREEHSSHDRWVVSYADFVTLLFAFFVVMYSISSVNEGKYRVLSDSLDSAFGSANYSIDSIQEAALDTRPSSSSEEENTESIMIPLLLEHQRNQNPAEEQSEAQGGEELEDKLQRDKSFTQRILDKAETEIDGIASDVEHEMTDLIDDELLNIKRNKFWLEVEVKTSLLFPSGSSELIPDSRPPLEKLARIFAELPNRIHVEGFTDDRPIRTLIFPSNWELSAARAAAVVRLFEQNGVDPSRMASIGYGEYHPVADNDSEEGRAKNRRVVMVVMASLEGREDERIYEFDLLKEQTAANLEDF